MDQFLIDLAVHANWERFMPFPDNFRQTTQPNTPHTKEEYDYFISQLQAENKEAIQYVTNVDRGIVQHNAKSIHPLVTEFEFQYDAIDNYKKNLKYPQRWYLFHGSPLGNWHSILRNGIKNMSGTRFMSTGQAYGPGVYASNNLSIAYGYGGHGKSHCVAVIEVLVDPEQYRKAEGIYVIPDDKLLFPRYLFRMTGLPKTDGKEILAYYKKLREGLIKPKTKVKRMEADRQAISHCFIEPLTDYCWSIVIDGVLCRCYVFNYPFTVPVIQLCNVIDEVKSKDAMKYFDSYGCYQYPFLEWSPQNEVLDVVKHAKKHVEFSTLVQKKEEYATLESL